MDDGDLIVVGSDDEASEDGHSGDSDNMSSLFTHLNSSEDGFTDNEDEGDDVAALQVIDGRINAGTCLGAPRQSKTPLGLSTDTPTERTLDDAVEVTRNGVSSSQESIVKDDQLDVGMCA